MASFKDSPAYQEVLAATRAMDPTRKMQIIRDQVARTTGNEKAHWLLLQVEMLMVTTAPGHWEMSWDGMAQALQMAPDDLDLRKSALNDALLLCIKVERFDRFLPFVKQLGPKLHILLDTPAITYNIGLLHLRYQKWYQAYRWMTRSVDLHHALPDSHQRSRGGYLMVTRALRCVAAIRLGKEAEATADVNFLRELLPTYPPGYFDPLLMSLPEAELAFFQGRLNGARAALQQGFKQAQTVKYRSSPYILNLCDLLAARMALAEGNLAAFRHYCEQALARCREHDLRISEKTVRAVMAAASSDSQHDRK